MNQNIYHGDGRNTDGLAMFSSHCRGFSRRHDFDTFSMSTYQTCENCRHLSADNTCMMKMQNMQTMLE